MVYLIIIFDVKILTITGRWDKGKKQKALMVGGEYSSVTAKIYIDKIITS